MLKLRKRHPVRTLGAAVLRQKAQPISAMTDEVRELAEEMTREMRKYDGIGIAAPQVGVSKKLVVFDIPMPPEGQALSSGEAALLPLMPLAVVNPEIEASSSTLSEYDEGCLSVPGIFATVVRPERVVLHATLLDGTEIRYECGGLLGRCVQHELDHLDGVLFPDRVAPAELEKVRDQLAELEREGAKKNFRR